MTATWTVYGLKTCDTCRKARTWLEGAGIAHRFVDLRAEPVAVDEIARWVGIAGEGLLNRRGTTWRGLSDEEKARADAPGGVAALCAAYPALIKRPVFVRGDAVLTGFTDPIRDALGTG
ncbi:MAG: ArsC/Spx/MgsR family protein [Pseudomonadota bacterium]|nr:ArsC/Spx/MgsR family protein [Pseudomonadota bacterium]